MAKYYVYSQSTRDDLEALRDAINASAYNFMSNEEINHFLLENKTEKDGHKRFLAYLFKLQIVDANKNLGNQIITLIQKYENLMYQIFYNNTNGITPGYYQSQEYKLISNEIPRNFNYFRDLCSFLSLSNCLTDEIIYAQKRVLIMESFTEKPNLTYTQGFDRIMFLSYALSLSFMQKYSLPTKYAEPVAYFILKKLLYMINMKEIINNPASFPLNLIDENLSKVREDVDDELRKQFSDSPISFYYAFKWRLLMFADDHKSPDVLLIFDQYLAHLEALEKYFICLCLAHVKQVTYEDPSLIIPNLQNTMTVNVNQAINDANFFFNDPKIIPKNPLLDSQITETLLKKEILFNQQLESNTFVSYCQE